jgi:hypothetical protein
VAADCQSGECTRGFCTACSDGTKDGFETDVDCGGPACASCALGKHCLRTVRDCVGGGACVNGACTVATCSDGILDGSESAVDCGGSTCAPCGLNQTCAANSDCQSSYCFVGQCLLPLCADGIQDGDETDVDCGGATCAPCAVGKHCSVTRRDCTLEGLCLDGTCRAPTCSDGVRDGTETAIDCGGSCGPCPVGGPCTGAADCQSKLCVSGQCQAATCSDGVQDGYESDVDCGGGQCSGCAAGQKCLGGYMCQSGECDTGRCVTCSDGLKNGTETDIDCGGAFCPACAIGKQCVYTQSDCGPGAGCVLGRCQAATCTDGVKDGTETGVDCGGGTCAPCPLSNACNAAADCLSGECSHGLCSACSDGVKDGFETDVDCGGPACGPCALGKQCRRSVRDCAGAGACMSGVCTSPTCTDGVKDGTETDIDCGGNTCAPCAVYRQCTTGSDCQSKACFFECWPPTCTDGIQNSDETDIDCGGVTCGSCAAAKHCLVGPDCKSGLCSGFTCTN